MRRRTREATDTDAPPAELLTFTGTSNRDKLAWLRAREDWWKRAHPEGEDPDQIGSLQWLFDGHEQIGDFRWCGSVGAPCTDPDCLCVVWPEHLELEAHTHSTPQTSSPHDGELPPPPHFSATSTRKV